MARKSEFEKIVSDLVNAPWWASVIVAVVSYLFLKVGVPSWFDGKAVLNGLSEMSEGLAPVGFLFFCFLGLLAFFNAKRKAALVDKQTGVDSLRKLSWKEFEEMVAEAYRRQGFKVLENQTAGADGGVDLRLLKDGVRTLVQCKNWKTRKVGVKVVREMFGILAAEKANHVIVICSGTFTADAWDFVQDKPVDLIGGDQLLQLLNDVRGESSGDHSQEKQLSLLTPLEATGASSPQCPRCGSTMVARKASRGKTAGQLFWGCSTFPQCRGSLPI